MVRNDDANLPKEFRRLNADLSIEALVKTWRASGPSAPRNPMGQFSASAVGRERLSHNIVSAVVVVVRQRAGAASLATPFGRRKRLILFSVLLWCCRRNYRLA
jgi:hypothetical protein